MSGFFAIFNRDGRPVDRELTQSMLEGFSYWAPDDRGVWYDGPVALGHTMLWNTPESKLEKLPCRKDHLVITMDARLDNREELAGQLGLDDCPLNEISESEFILRAYQKWGGECPKYLLGDFCFVIWDERKQQIFCARDHVGVKQFYYHLSEKLFVCGNDLKGLVKHPGISREICDEAVANYFIDLHLLSKTQTFFKEIEKLPSAHSLAVNHCAVKQSRFWELADAPRIILPDNQAYAERLCELIEVATRARTRSEFHTASHLSGGLDSSTISVIAAQSLEREGKTLHAYNWNPSQSNDAQDHQDSAAGLAIAKADKIPCTHLAIKANRLMQQMKQHNIVYGSTALFWSEYLVREHANTSGIRTILSGWGGDEFSSYHGHSFYCNLLIQGAFQDLYLELTVGGKMGFGGGRRLLGRINRRILLPLIPRRLYHLTARFSGDFSNYEFAAPAFLPKILNEEKKRNADALSMQPHRTIKTHMRAFWQHGHLQNRIESWTADAWTNRLEYRYPLLDKNIIEFMLQVPTQYHVRNGYGRYLFRRAAEHWLPPALIWSNPKPPETIRVQHLINTVSDSYKKIAREELEAIKHYNYFDCSKIIEAIKRMDETRADKDNNAQLSILGALAQALLSPELNQT